MAGFTRSMAEQWFLSKFCFCHPAHWLYLILKWNCVGLVNSQLCPIIRYLLVHVHLFWEPEVNEWRSNWLSVRICYKRIDIKIQRVTLYHNKQNNHRTKWRNVTFPLHSLRVPFLCDASKNARQRVAWIPYLEGVPGTLGSPRPLPPGALIVRRPRGPAQKVRALFPGFLRGEFLSLYPFSDRLFTFFPFCVTVTNFRWKKELKKAN